MVDGTNTLNDGAGTLKDGVNTLKDGVLTLDEGTGTLDEGVLTLMNGMFEFDEEGIRKLTGYRPWPRQEKLIILLRDCRRIWTAV